MSKKKVFNPEFTSPTGYPTFYRTYSRKDKGKRESYSEVINRGIKGLKDLGNLSKDQLNLIKEMWEKLYALPSGRWHWIGGTEWSKEPENYFGSYNCSNVTVEDWFDFFYNFDTLMQGCGTGTVVEDENISKLPSIKRKITLNVLSEPGKYKNAPVKPKDSELTLNEKTKEFLLIVGDTRIAWSQAFTEILNLSSVDNELTELVINIEFGYVRPSGTPIKGFGGTANPQKLVEGFNQLVRIINGAVERQLTVVEVCKILGISAAIAVAGNIRRSARINQCNKENKEFEVCKDNLWTQDENGNWKIDPESDVLRYANHTITYHTKPTLEEVTNSVTKQFYSGEGALQYVPEAIKRCNVDILESKKKQNHFIALYVQDKQQAKDYLTTEFYNKYKEVISSAELEHRIGRFGLNPCLTGDTKILTIDGVKTFKELASTEEDVVVWCIDLETNQPKVSTMRRPHKTGFNVEVLEIEFDSGLKVKATHDHNFFTTQRNKIKASQLKPGMSVAAFNIHEHRDGHLRILKNEKATDTVKQYWTHRIIANFFGIDGEIIHHKDGNPKNNHPNNLQAVSREEHTEIHRLERIYKNSENYTNDLVDNHKVVSVREVGREDVYNGMVEDYHNYVIVDDNPVGKSYISGILSANCGEIISKNFLCNLAEVHLNQIDPFDLITQEKAFKAAGICVSVFLHHVFPYPKLQESRELDPIVGVSFTGLFDFFVNAFGVEWLNWWKLGRPDDFCVDAKYHKNAQDVIEKISDLLGLSSDQYIYENEDTSISLYLAEFFIDAERCYLEYWKGTVQEAVEEYCTENNLRVPNRCTTVQPAGSKSLLTGASCGWHPPKAERYIRRITFRRDDPVALACIDYGYNVLPSQSCIDDNGNLLNDPYDPRTTEWLIEIPVAVNWADVADKANIDINKFTAEAQYKFYMQVQKYYTEHNTSATLEIRKDEIDTLAKLIYESIEKNHGYISATVLARFDDLQNFPRLPFEPITKEIFDQMNKEVLERRISDDFYGLLTKYDKAELDQEIYIGGCDSEKCEIDFSKK